MGDGMLSLSWNNHKATFCHILANLRDKERYTDVTLACEGKFYRVHKLVLSTCSEYFEVMFENTPCKHPVIVLNHIKHDEVEALLSYMYAGVVNVAQNDLARLIKAAELLKIKGLAVPDEPPQEAEARKSHPSPWSSRDERTSPLPKRRRKDDSGTPQGGSQTSNSPASSPRASPYTENSDYVDKIRTHSDGLSSDHRGEKTDVRGDPLSIRGEDDSDKKGHRTPSLESPSQTTTTNIVDESLVKEEIVDTIDDSRDDLVDSGMDYGTLGADSRLEGSNDGSNTMMPNKYDQPLIPSQSQLSEPVVEALAGPSGMQGWLGDMGGGFSSVESFRGEGSQQDLRQPLPGQQPHQMAVVKDVIQVGMVNDVVQLGLGKDVIRLGMAKNIFQMGMVEDTKGVVETDPLREGPREVCRVGVAKNIIRRGAVKAEGRSRVRGRRPGAYGNYKKGGFKKGHSDVKKFDCSYCDYVTVTSTNLLNHMRTHTGEKPFACDHCPYRSTQKGNLRTHVTKHHSEEQESRIKIVDVQGMVYQWHDPFQEDKN